MTLGHLSAVFRLFSIALFVAQASIRLPAAGYAKGSNDHKLNFLDVH